LNTRDNVYVFDGFAGWDPKYRIKVRVIASRAYHALFMVSLARSVSVDRRNMLDAD
jgi:ATP-dependent phosphoenolpyruvate carboxykinase